MQDPGKAHSQQTQLEVAELIDAEEAMLAMYVVTENTAGYPGKIVVHRYLVFKGRVDVDDHPTIVHAHLPSVERQLSMSFDLRPVGRNPNKDPNVLGVWV